MPEIQTGDPGRKLQRRYSLLGPPPAPFLSPEIVPVTVVDDLTGIDTLEAAFQRPAVVQRSQTAGVGQYATIEFVNPAASGMIATVESWLASVATANSDVFVQLFEAPTATVSVHGYWRDGRLEGRAACGVNSFNLGAAPTLVWNHNVVGEADPEQLVSIAYVVPPGWELRFQQSLANDTVAIRIFWSERIFPPEEAGGAGGGL